MSRVHLQGALWAGLLAFFLAGAEARAEDERGRWSFAVGLGAHSTFDDIRSNAGVVITCDQDDRNCNGFIDNTEVITDGVTTGTPVGEEDLSDDVIMVNDPRQDDLMARQTKVEEKQRFDFSAAYGLTSWLSLQIETGLYRGDVAPFDVHTSSERWAQPTGVASPENWKLVTEEISEPMTLGELTQIPLTFNAVVRFRRDSPFNPFLGIGVGYMFNDLEESAAFQTLNARILRGFNRRMALVDGTSEQAFNIQEIYPGFKAPENTPSIGGLIADPIYSVDCTETGDPAVTYVNICTSRDPIAARAALLPNRPFIEAEVSDGFLYQFSVGADYHFNERWSAYVAARYQVTDAKVNVKVRGTDPVNGEFECTMCTFRFISENNPQPPDASKAENLFYRTPTGAGSDPQFARLDTLQERILVQGGEIDLSAFTIGAGIRFTF